MTQDQIVLFALLITVFGLLIWGRWRYDMVAFAALIVAVIVGVVPKDQAFSGFGHPATAIIALVLVVSRALLNSGAIDLIARAVVDASRALSAHIAIMSSLAAALSAVINNVGALALLMPVDLQAAANAKRSPALTLMPLSFASILGGMVTLIGTPPNIIIAAHRETSQGTSFAMFDFAPVGLAVALAGVAFVALVGWRLIPTERGKHDSAQELFELDDYIVELRVRDKSPAIGQRVGDLQETAGKVDAVILGIVRRGERLKGSMRWRQVRKGDFLVVEAAPKNVEELVGKLGLEYAGSEKHAGLLSGADVSMAEVVVPQGARIENRSARSVRLLNRHGVTLLGVSRQGERFRERVRGLTIQAGDILLLYGPTERLAQVTDWLGCLPLAERGLQVIQRNKAWMAVGLFAAAVILASTGVLYLPIALAAVAGLMVFANIVPLRQVYESIEWPVIVLLGSLIPIGQALETAGGTALIAGGIISMAEGAPPWVLLTLLLVVTMTLSDVLNNTATAIIAAPVAVSIANDLGTSADPFLMAVAVGASCAFLTPIGHKNNTLIMGPGGYKFGDYWRMGLPLEILVILVAVPTILIVWPF